MRLYELREKEVVNTKNGRVLGNVIDLDIDCRTGKVCALIIPGECKCFGLFGFDNELIIPWCAICRIGPDIILVDVDEKEVKRHCK